MCGYGKAVEGVGESVIAASHQMLGLDYCTDVMYLS